MFNSSNGRQKPAFDREQGTVTTKTREVLLHYIASRGPITAIALAELVDRSPTAIRRHLDHAEEQGLITQHPLPATGKRGRPARGYILTREGHKEFPDGHVKLSLDLLKFISTHLGPDSLESLAQKHAEQLTEQVRRDKADGVLTSADSITISVEDLVASMQRRGYNASLRSVENHPTAGVQICRGHCPIHDVAKEYPQFCEAEAAAISELLGVHVQRLASLASGDHVCTTFIPESGQTSTPASPQSAKDH